MKRKNILRYIVLPLVLVLAAAAFYIWKEYNRTHKDTSQLKPDFTLAAEDLIREFEENEPSSNRKYWDKIIAVTGVVKKLLSDEGGFYSVVLGDTGSLSSVRCSMDSAHNAEAAKVIKGSLIRMKGICSGFNKDEMLGSDVILVRSVVDREN